MEFASKTNFAIPSAEVVIDPSKLLLEIIKLHRNTGMPVRLSLDHLRRIVVLPSFPRFASSP